MRGRTNGRGSRGLGRFAETFELEGESLKRPPRGYDPDHPLVEDLKRKDFVVVTSFSEEEALRDDLLEWFAGIARRGAPFVEFLSNAVEVEF